MGNSFRHPGNGQHPETYQRVFVVVRDSISKEKREGVAYWSGMKWVAVNGFRISPGRVIEWSL